MEFRVTFEGLIAVVKRRVCSGDEDEGSEIFQCDEISFRIYRERLNAMMVAQ